MPSKEILMSLQSTSTRLFIEFADRSDQIAGWTDNGNTALKAIAASEAFRKYDWLTSMPITNDAGDFRGMVISGRWGAVFNFSSEVGDVVGNIAILASFATNLVQASSQIDTIWHSNDTWETKGARISTQVSSAAIRTLGGVIPGGTHLLALSLQGYCGMADLATQQSLMAPKQCIQKLQSMDTWVRSTFDKVTDGYNIHLWIQTHLAAR